VAYRAFDNGYLSPLICYYMLDYPLNWAYAAFPNAVSSPAFLGGDQDAFSGGQVLAVVL